MAKKNDNLSGETAKKEVPSKEKKPAKKEVPSKEKKPAKKEV
ncbi:MAG: transcriptional regulator, partial [Nitrosopumilaceae archaeon]